MKKSKNPKNHGPRRVQVITRGLIWRQRVEWIQYPHLLMFILKRQLLTAHFWDVLYSEERGGVVRHGPDLQS